MISAHTPHFIQSENMSKERQMSKNPNYSKMLDTEIHKLEESGAQPRLLI